MECKIQESLLIIKNRVVRMDINDEEYEKDNPFGLDSESDFHTTRRNTTISLISENFKNREKLNILDVGCGKGNITKFIGQHFTNSKIDAIDISERAIELAIIDEAKIKFIHADAIDFKGFGYLYDVIVLNNIYEHVENPAGILVNLKQILTDDGVFIISTPNRYSVKNIIKKLFGLRITIPRYHITEYSMGQITDHHKYAGLTVKKFVLPKFRREKIRFSDFIIYRIIQPIFDTYLKIIRSQTRLGSLLFIVSSK